jgi:hypothetical protein
MAAMTFHRRLSDGSTGSRFARFSSQLLGAIKDRLGRVPTLDSGSAASMDPTSLLHCLVRPYIPG